MKFDALSIVFKLRRTTLITKTRALVLIFASMFIMACTNSKLVLRPIYNSLDNRIEERVLEYTEFDKAQTDAIKQLVDHYHIWHRQTQLPHYALLLENVVSKLDNPKDISIDDVKRWNGIIDDYRSNVILCNPFYGSADIVASLSQEQIVDIQNNREEASERRRNNRQSEEEDEDDVFSDSASERVKQVNQYLGFIGIKLNSEQQADLAATMEATAQTSTRGRNRELFDRLDAEFFTLLDQRKTSNWEETFIDHLLRRRETISNLRADVTTSRTEAWQAYAVRTFQSLDSEQQSVAKRYLSGLASTLNALSNDQPGAKNLRASEYRCVGQLAG